MTTSNNKKPLMKLPSSIWAIGFVSLLSDIASEMIHSLLPVFMVSVLGASAITVGVVEGMAESTALIVKLFSGALSDYLGRRKFLAIIGYTLGALSKPIFALANSITLVFTARFLDRIGKGIRGAPRDALVADISPPSMMGAAFGLRQALDTVGAFIGPVLAIVLMSLWNNNIRAVFWVAVIPGLLSVFVLLIGVHEPDKIKGKKLDNPIHWRELKKLNATFWWVVIIGSVFTLARFSEAFLLLRAQQVGLPIYMIPLVLVTMNIVYAISAYPFGSLSDGMNPKKLLAIGLVLLTASDLILAFGNNLFLMFFGVCLWGLHMGATQGVLAAMIANTTQPHLRGSAFGFFYLASGITMLIASVLAGLLWDKLGSSFTFNVGAIFCVLSLVGIALMPGDGPFTKKTDVKGWFND